MIRILLTASCSLLALVACAPRTTPAAEPAVEPAPGTGAEPAAIAAAPVAPDGFTLAYAQETDTYTVRLDTDPQILSFDPALAYRLWTEHKAGLDALGQQATDDRAAAEAEAAASGEASWFRGYSMDIEQKAHAILGDVISVEERVSTYTGGAHPNYFLGGSVYRKGAAEPVAVSEIIADQAGFEALVIRGLTEQKLARGFEASDRVTIAAEIREMLAPTAEMPDMYSGRVLLEPSDEPGKAGGLRVLFSPYDVGAYAEGAYEVSIPASALQPLLTQEWAPRFGGQIPPQRD